MDEDHWLDCPSFQDASQRIVATVGSAIRMQSIAKAPAGFAAGAGGQD